MSDSLRKNALLRHASINGHDPGTIVASKPSSPHSPPTSPVPDREPGSTTAESLSLPETSSKLTYGSTPPIVKTSTVRKRFLHRIRAPWHLRGKEQRNNDNRQHTEESDTLEAPDIVVVPPTEYAASCSSEPDDTSGNGIFSDPTVAESPIEEVPRIPIAHARPPPEDVPQDALSGPGSSGMKPQRDAMPGDKLSREPRGLLRRLLPSWLRGRKKDSANATNEVNPPQRKVLVGTLKFGTDLPDEHAIPGTVDASGKSDEHGLTTEDPCQSNTNNSVQARTAGNDRPLVYTWSIEDKEGTAETSSNGLLCRGNEDSGLDEGNSRPRGTQAEIRDEEEQSETRVERTKPVLKALSIPDDIDEVPDLDISSSPPPRPPRSPARASASLAPSPSSSTRHDPEIPQGERYERGLKIRDYAYLDPNPWRLRPPVPNHDSFPVVPVSRATQLNAEAGPSSIPTAPSSPVVEIAAPSIHEDPVAQSPPEPIAVGNPPGGLATALFGPENTKASVAHRTIAPTPDQNAPTGTDKKKRKKKKKKGKKQLTAQPATNSPYPTNAPSTNDIDMQASKDGLERATAALAEIEAHMNQVLSRGVLGNDPLHDSPRSIESKSDRLSITFNMYNSPSPSARPPTDVPPPFVQPHYLSYIPVIPSLPARNEREGEWPAENMGRPSAWPQADSPPPGLPSVPNPANKPAYRKNTLDLDFGGGDTWTYQPPSRCNSLDPTINGIWRPVAHPSPPPSPSPSPPSRSRSRSRSYPSPPVYGAHEGEAAPSNPFYAPNPYFAPLNVSFTLSPTISITDTARRATYTPIALIAQSPTGAAFRATVALAGTETEKEKEQEKEKEKEEEKENQRRVAVHLAHKVPTYANARALDALRAEVAWGREVTRLGLFGRFVVPLLSSWEDDLGVYMVYPEYMCTLDEWMRVCHPDYFPFYTYAAELTIALDALHEHNILHNAINPHNVLVTPSGHLLLANLSHATSLSSSPSSSPSPSPPSPSPPHPSQILSPICTNNPTYWPPERYAALGRFHTTHDPRVLHTITPNPAEDVFALGLVLLDMHAERGYVRAQVTFDGSGGGSGGCERGGGGGGEDPRSGGCEETVRMMERYNVMEDDEYVRGMVGRYPELYDLWSVMLHPDPQKRWSAKRVKSHPVFAHVDMEAVCDRAGHVVRPRNRQFEREPAVRPSDLYAPGTINPSFLPPSSPSSPPSLNQPSLPSHDQPTRHHSPQANDQEFQADEEDEESFPDKGGWNITLPASVFRTFVAVAAAGGAAQWFSQAWNAWWWWDGVGRQ